MLQILCSSVRVKAPTLYIKEIVKLKSNPERHIMCTYGNNPSSPRKRRKVNNKIIIKKYNTIK